MHKQSCTRYCIGYMLSYFPTYKYLCKGYSINYRCTGYCMDCILHYFPTYIYIYNGYSIKYRLQYLRWRTTKLKSNQTFSTTDHATLVAKYPNLIPKGGFLGRRGVLLPQDIQFLPKIHQQDLNKRFNCSLIIFKISSKQEICFEITIIRREKVKIELIILFIDHFYFLTTFSIPAFNDSRYSRTL